MEIKIYDLTVPQLINGLQSLKNILKKAQTYSESKKVEASVLLSTRLVPDQFPLSRQIQITCDTAKNGLMRLTGVEAPVFEDKEQSFDEFYTRIDKTISYLQKIKAENFHAYEMKRITFHWNPGSYTDGKSFLLQHLIPNFYFHLTTTYSILRSIGMELGKADYLGNVNWKSDK